MHLKKLTKSLLVALSLTCAFTTVASVLPNQQSIAYAAADDYKSYAKKIKNHTGIVVNYSSIQAVSSGLTFQQIKSSKSLTAGMKRLNDVFAYYPKDLTTILSMPEVNLVEKMWADDTRIEGVAYGFSRKGSSKIERVYLYLTYPSQAEAESVYHHELFHAIEYIFPPKESSWSKLGYDSYYGIDSEDYTGSRRGNFILNRRTGYVTDYSYSEAAEDRAEIYAYIMDPFETDVFLKSAFSCDRILQEKSTFIQKYIHTVFDKIPDSERLTKRFDSRYNELFARPYLAAKALATVDANITLYDTHDGKKSASQSYDYNKGDVFYIVDILKDPQTDYLAVDKNGHLVFLPKNKASILPIAELSKTTASLKDKGITMAYVSDNEKIVGASLLENGETNVNEANLIHAQSININKWLSAQEGTLPIDKIILLDGLKVDGKTKSAFKNGKTVYIDVRHATYNNVVSAIKG